MITLKGIVPTVIWVEKKHTGVFFNLTLAADKDWYIGQRFDSILKLLAKVSAPYKLNSM